MVVWRSGWLAGEPSSFAIAGSTWWAMNVAIGSAPGLRADWTSLSFIGKSGLGMRNDPRMAEGPWHVLHPKFA